MLNGKISPSRASKTNQIHGRIFLHRKSIQIYRKTLSYNLSLGNPFFLREDLQHVILPGFNIDLNGSFLQISHGYLYIIKYDMSRSNC